MKAKKIIAPILLLLVISVLSAIGYLSWTARQVAQQIITVSGLIGSEKKDFFDDPEVQRILADDYQLKVEYESVGSRRIATVGGAKGAVNKYDFAFPAGTPAAEKISRDYHPTASYRIFFTPMAVASWRPVVDVLQKNGIVQKRTANATNAGYYGILDMNALLNLMYTQTRWKDLPNNQSFDIGRQVLIKSTNITSSNSAAMYLSLASYLANQDQVVANSTQAAQVLPSMLPLFSNQGFLAGSSATPFEDYLIKGMGNSPLVMIYESQYLYQASLNDGSIRNEMILLYPEPTIFTQHTLLAMNEAGEKLGAALNDDPQLQKLAIAHGYRSNNTALTSAFEQNLTQHNIEYIPTTLTEVIETPSYDLLELMISKLESQLNQ
ncbi:hypothetical protein [Psychrobacter sp. I-STPA10]|uniref:hypothetical protein n=1 Tax=Psychrobacter sp. I-STPA10 TaxID=2585769 RepID=UPI001E29D711|nr:hypothetical protein [Psychrobacter sp. I-STPA10]